ncbi:cadmium-translocating P-type ATPase, partial [bacterium]|nr:cadmium-translocating P-type ATPase [bacterium]
MTALLTDPHRRHLALTALVAAGLAAYLTGAVTAVYGFDAALILALVGGFPIYSAAVTELLERKVSADLAVGIAAIAALAIGQYAVAAEVILIMLIGEALENFAVGRTRSAIERLLALRPDEARVRRDGAELLVPLADIRPDDVVLVRPGDRLPVDGRVLAGASSIDQSPITGESLPADKAPGDDVFAGTINQFGALEIAVERLGEDTQLEHIIRLVEEAEEAKAPTERLADRYATWFVPVVLLTAFGTWFFTHDVVRSVAVLVVACPCALVLAAPTAVAAGIGRLVRRGVLVKGGGVLERLARLKTAVFDKTGTLTQARLRVAQVVAASEGGESEVLRLAAAVEASSEHPIASLIVARAREENFTVPSATDFAAHPGLGAVATVEAETVRVGNARFLDEAGIRIPDALTVTAADLADGGRTLVLVARGNDAIGTVAVEDTVRPEARPMLDRLRALGVARFAMLTGDSAAAARAVASALGIDDVRAELLPVQKVAAIRAIQA